jgi:hypothetical protein
MGTIRLTPKPEDSARFPDPSVNIIGPAIAIGILGLVTVAIARKT